MSTILKTGLLVSLVSAATKIVTPDHEDPTYTDACYELTREMCDFCCLVDFEFCARDIGICEPIAGRNLGILLHCVYVFTIILCGIPVIIHVITCFMTWRCCVTCYPTTAGLSFYDLIMKCLCFTFCCGRTFKEYHETDEEGNARNLPAEYLMDLLCCRSCREMEEDHRPAQGDEKDAAALAEEEEEEDDEM